MVHFSSVFVGLTDAVGLCATDLVLWEVRVHLVPVEIGVVRFAVGVVQTQRLLARKDTRL